jgi:aconitate hydratase
MGYNVAQKLLASHLVDGQMEAGTVIGLCMDQTLTQDATGTLVMLELEAMGVERVRTELSAQYVDHNLLQTDFKNADDHLFLRSACQKFGLWSSRPGNGVSHAVHMERFGVPGKTLLGADSHTCAAGALGMLAIGAGGLEVALAMAGEPYHLRMPHIWGVRITGTLPDWVSAKDVILEMLRRHSVAGRVRARARSWKISCTWGSWPSSFTPERACIRPGATVALAWDKPRPRAASVCVPCRAISQAVLGPQKTRCTCVARKRLQPRR